MEIRKGPSRALVIKKRITMIIEVFKDEIGLKVGAPIYHNESVRIEN